MKQAEKQSSLKESLTDVAVVRGAEVRAYVAVGRAQEAWTESRMLLLGTNGIVGYHDVKARMISVDAHPDVMELAALAGSGAVSVAKSAGVTFEFIEQAGTGKGKYGFLKRIRYVGDTLCACGDLRQVYRRTNGAWHRFDSGLRIDDIRVVGYALNDIAGEDVDRAYAVGDRGTIVRFDGERWIDCDAPVNANLERVMVDAQGTLWACGSKGTIVRGREDSWEVVAFNQKRDDTFWGMTYYRGEIFVCSSAGLYQLSGDELEKVDVADFYGEPYRLAADDEFLWLLGVNELMRFDGEEWKRVSWRSS